MRFVSIVLLLAITATAPAVEPLPPGVQLRLSTPVDLETALQWTLQGNPGLITVRQSIGVSAEALHVAQHFPTSLNPTVSIDVRPWVFGRQANGDIQRLDRAVNVTWAQPVEIGHRQTYREQMAQSSYCQTQWNVLQVELTTLIQTYRVHQTSLYRREKLLVAQQLNDFNGGLVASLRRQAVANQASAADVLLAEVENQSTVELLETARQEYIASLTDLRQQIGMPQYAASAEPVGTLRTPQ